MAAALQCPACGTAHPIDEIDGPKFRCSSCGQVLSVPAAALEGRSPQRAPSRAPSRPLAPPVVASQSATPPPPPPRRPGGEQVGGALSVTLPAREPSPRAPATRRPAPGVTNGTVVGDGDVVPPGARPAPARRPHPGVHWYWQVLAWVVALPLGLVVTAIPLYDRLITKDDLVDVFIGSGMDRYARLALAVAIWALVSAILVQVFVEGGRVLAARRAPSRPAPARAAPAANDRPGGPRA